jgi:hypothetical protein
MSRHFCVGVLPKNKTCYFQNIYYDGINSKVRGVGRFLYFVSVPSKEMATPAAAAALLNATRVSVPPFARVLGDHWEMSAVFFLRTGVGRVPCAHSTKARCIPVPLQHTASVAGWEQPGNVSSGALATPCHLSPASPLHRLNGSCLPSGVSAVVTQPVFYLMRTSPFNVAHWLWDDAIPTHGAISDLGLRGCQSEVQLLMCDADIPAHRVDTPIVKETWKGVGHKHQPAKFEPFQVTAQGSIVKFSHIMTGLKSRGTHHVHKTYSVYGAPDKRVVWDFRQFYLAGLGIEHDNDWHANRPSASGPLKVTVLQKPEKRVIQNLTAVLEDLKQRFPQAEFQETHWEKLGGHTAEVQRLLDTHILVSADGTGSLTLFMLPPGAVHISLGIVTPRGSGNMADFIYSGVDHIRVLYYDGLPPQPGSTNNTGALEVPASKLAPFIARAIALVTGGFTVPVPFLTNHSPNGRLCYRLFNYFPELADVASDMWVSAQVPHHDPCDLLRRQPRHMYKQFVGREPPEPFDDVVVGTIGIPSGPDVNEVSGVVPA